MPGMCVVHWWRATCFGQPIGPWRDRMGHMLEDLEAQRLGCRDHTGTFYITVPGDYERRSAWVEIEDVA